ncbi:helix-turn-helix domain-containing protein [Shouchella sp. JSM 1781072]|uniref:helix-turn-helix domain-containing protein n=1 Tax=Shouchella sp. JSM 1781072 TaxID=3344581 RepID=UPI0035C1D05E
MSNLFSVRVKELRKEHKTPQKEIADALGISPRAYRFYESGDRYPDFEGLLILADFYGVSLDYLAGRSELRERK